MKSIFVNKKTQKQALCSGLHKSDIYMTMNVRCTFSGICVIGLFFDTWLLLANVYGSRKQHKLHAVDIDKHFIHQYVPQPPVMLGTLCSGPVILSFSIMNFSNVEDIHFKTRFLNENIVLQVSCESHIILFQIFVKRVTRLWI